VGEKIKRLARPSFEEIWAGDFYFPLI